MLSIFFPSAILIYYFTIFFYNCTIIKNNSIVDIGWGFGFILVTLLLFFFRSFTAKSILVSVLVITWGSRLSIIF